MMNFSLGTPRLPTDPLPQHFFLNDIAFLANVSQLPSSTSKGLLLIDHVTIRKAGHELRGSPNCGIA